jgi:hypothetical protein
MAVANPYQSPETTHFYSTDAGAGAPWAQPFVSGHALAVWTTLFLVATVVLQVFASGISVTSLYIIRHNIASGTGVNIFGQGHILLHGMIGFLLLMVFNSIATMAAFLLWIHRVYGNLPALHAAKLRFSPNKAVGVFLVPVLNLFLPLRVVREIWRESDPALLEIGKAEKRNGMKNLRGTSPAIIDAWWVAMLATAFFNLGGRFFQNVGITLGEWRIFISSTICSIAALSAICIVRRIDRFQQRRNEMLAAAETS